MADFLEEKKAEISARLDELRPAVEEFHKLEAALDALDGVNQSGGGGSSSSRGPGRPRRSSGSGSSGSGSGGGNGRRGRPRGSGQRAAESLEIVESNPGITIPEMAQKMGIQQNYLYRVLPTLEQDGKVRKEGRGWYPTEGDAADD